MFLSPEHAQYPAFILQLPESVPDVLIADASTATLWRFANGGDDVQQIDRRHRIRVKREVAENVLLANVREKLLGDDVIRYMRQSVRVAIREYRKRAQSDSTSVNQLVTRRREIDEKLERIADAIESMWISDTLRDRLRQLERDRTSIEDKLIDVKKAKPCLSALPDIIPGLSDAWREIVEGMTEIASNPHALASDVQAARDRLHALLGPVVLEPRDGVLWAHPSPNAKSLVETRLSGRLHINSQILVAGA